MRIEIAEATTARPHHIVMMVEATKIHMRRCANATDAEFIRRQWREGRFYMFPATEHKEFDHA
jgi:hypothetical protein